MTGTDGALFGTLSMFLLFSMDSTAVCELPYIGLQAHRVVSVVRSLRRIDTSLEGVKTAGNCE
jgi:hypothetical protein